MTNFIWIVFAHFIGDFAYQSSWISENKGRYWYILFAHGMIWTACICIALQFLGIYMPWKVLFLLVGHILCDQWKISKLKTSDAWHLIYYDQLFHLAQLLVVFFQ